MIVGSATSTGTANQILQISNGGAYISGSVGIGTTRPIGQFQVGAASTSSVLVVTSAGSVGLGTTNPLQRLHVVDAIVVSSASTSLSNAIQTKTYTNQYSIEDVDGFGTRQYISINKSDTDLFKINDDSFNTRFVVNASGSVGIGTTTPTVALTVVGNSLITGITTIGIGATSTPPSNSQLSFELTSDTNLRIKVRGTDGVLRSANITLA